MNITCLTLSKSPFNRSENLPLDQKYFNYNSAFKTELGLKKSFINALEYINTEFFYSCDDDDEIPDKIILPNKGLIYGDNYDFFVRHLTKNASMPWSLKDHINNPYFIHKAVYNTKAVKHVIKHIPDIELNFYFVLHFLIAATYGSEYNPALKIIWNKKPTGMHLAAFKCKQQTLEWLKQNHVFIIEKINNERLILNG